MGGKNWPVYAKTGPIPITYDGARELNKGFLAVAQQLQPLRSLAVYHAGMLPEGTVPLPERVVFHLDPLLPRKDYAAFVEGLVIGYFGSGDSPTHALVVNLDYRTYGGRGQPRRDEFIEPVRRAIVGPGKLEVYDAGARTWLPAGSNRAELRLPPGAGKLVRVRFHAHAQVVDRGPGRARVIGLSDPGVKTEIAIGSHRHVQALYHGLEEELPDDELPDPKPEPDIGKVIPPPSPIPCAAP